MIICLFFSAFARKKKVKAFNEFLIEVLMALKIDMHPQDGIWWQNCCII